MTKTELIIMLAKQKLDRASIAKIADVSPNYVNVVLWRQRHPGYGGRWMAQKRATDPAYYAKELAQQEGWYGRKHANRPNANRRSLQEQIRLGLWP